MTARVVFAIGDGDMSIFWIFKFCWNQWMHLRTAKIGGMERWTYGGSLLAFAVEIPAVI
jgi:hypothetical protein